MPLTGYDERALACFDRRSSATGDPELHTRCQREESVSPAARAARRGNRDLRSADPTGRQGVVRVVTHSGRVTWSRLASRSNRPNVDHPRSIDPAQPGEGLEKALGMEDKFR